MAILPRMTILQDHISEGVSFGASGARDMAGMEGRLTEPNNRGRCAMVRRCSRGSRLLGRVEMESDDEREGGRCAGTYCLLKRG
jgi:hypothetical protein